MDKEKRTVTSQLMPFIKPYKKKFTMSIILAIAGVAMGLVPYIAVARMLIELLEGGKDLSFYFFWCGVAATSYILKVIFANVSTTLSHTAAFATLRDMRKKIISKLSRLPMGILIDTPSGNLKNIIVDRIEGLEITLGHLLPEMTANILVPVFILIYLFVIDWRMALVALITLPIGLAFMSTAMKTYPKQFEGSVAINKKMNNAIVEYIGGIEVIKTFNQGATSYEKYSNAVTDNASYFFNWMKSCQWAMASYTAICPATLLTVLPIGFLFYLNGSILASEFIVVMILSLGIVGPLLTAMNFTDSLAVVGATVSQIASLLETPELIRPTKDISLNDLSLYLNDVHFAYHEANVLNGVNLEIKAGTVTALVGPSGSGKSTIAKLIAGFWDVTNGTISLGNVNVKDIPQQQLASKISYVSQDNYLFDDTVRENIRMGRYSATDKEVEQAAKDAGCDLFIHELENGYDTRVGGAGGHLSGGERQRIAIARAMLKNAPIIILDEATAYIDPENEAVVQQAVSKLVQEKTLIVIAHRLSTITDSDQIAVIQNGKVIDSGTHKKLIQSSTLYRDMWQAHIGVKDGEEQ